ncbi:MAG: hypothetical protein CM1200mP41_06040 [Gammaproteobacteria bacterium]|nr:MAG: hypothetical protein CM1200mP41_06040 [Gammaproteobacteria bacterium]
MDITDAIDCPSRTFAHEVLDLNLWKDLDERTLNRLRIAWRRHGVLLFRRQSLSESELVLFFFTLGKNLKLLSAPIGNPEIETKVIHISNMKDASGRSIGGLGSGELDWHSDQSYMTHPATGALLYMVEMPNEGGATYWATCSRPMTH